MSAASEAFAKEGAQASLEEIARKAGVGVGTLYRHFSTREALIEALLREQLADLLELAERLSHDCEPAEALGRWLRAALRNSCTYRGLAGPIVSATSAHCDSSLGTPCSKMRQACDVLLARAKQAGKVRGEVNAGDVMTMVNAIAWSAEQSSGDTARSKVLMDVFLDGLGVGAGRDKVSGRARGL